MFEPLATTSATTELSAETRSLGDCRVPTGDWPDWAYFIIYHNPSNYHLFFFFSSNSSYYCLLSSTSASTLASHCISLNLPMSGVRKLNDEQSEYVFAVRISTYCAALRTLCAAAPHLFDVPSYSMCVCAIIGFFQPCSLLLHTCCFSSHDQRDLSFV